MKPSLTERYLQEVTFGLEDSLVSTVGTVTGMAIGSGNREIILLAGLVIIFVEATSMAAGSYLSDKVRHDADRIQGVEENGWHRPIVAGAFMGGSYLLAGVVPLAPYVFLPIMPAATLSVLFTLLTLFIVGMWQTQFTKRVWYKSGGEMLLVGGVAIVLGLVVGRLASQFLGTSIY
ncbi:MAG: hypothetical protein UY81_C0018G0006 [Candidatus Giovannonibacteria bacterium GW2011_GWA2_53_7]|uniref:Integral membrane protein n=1 Tax=Candidatus Giovannonibacteria bacterium GW2011_GWA2_53_7 TaxID=1618650 RepID=A0A0G2A6Z8_9BACT|nr:MAG: hypothetical protein UY81_C0018G0006 [Candidatus Giovannonibacteria bacterium GW2011_GWA2_53_7]